MSLAPGQSLGHYRIERLIGQGGMGAVFLALDTKLRRRVALKVLPEAMATDPDRLARFEREARAVAALNHPHIVTLFSIEEDRGTHFLTMELVEGDSLDHGIPPGGLPLTKVFDIGIALADALTAAHDKGVIHRDLKPANVIVTKDGRVKVLDFGLAKLAPEGPDAGPPASDAVSSAPTEMAPLHQTLTGAGSLLGTVPYMSPEQVGGETVDARTDIFTLGVLLYELATGRRPFAGKNNAQTMSSILRDAPRPVTEARPDTPRHLARIIEHCLRKEPRDRFQTARDVFNELRALRQEVESGVSAATDPIASPAGPAQGTGTGPLQAPPLPHPPLDRASIAVLPFDNLSGDSQQDYFADGIVEEIITGLSRIKWLFVISRHSTFIYKGKPADVKTVGRELGVSYVLQGSVRRSGKQVRVAGQLVDTATAAHVWAGRYDGKLGDIFTLQDEMTMSVISAIEPTLRKAEVERARRKRPDSLDAYDLFLHALPLATTGMPDDADKALHFLEEAIRLEPDYPAVHGLIAWCHEQRYLRGGLRSETRQDALVHAHAAIETGSDDAMALAMGGFVVGVLERDYETALEAIDRSLALSPSSALAFGFSSIIRAWKGEDATAIEHAKMGIRLGPYDPLIYLPYVGLTFAHLFTGNFAEAASAASRAAAANPRFSVPRYLHMVALVGLGRLDEAKAMADVVLRLQPGFTISGLVSGNITTPERMAMLADALRRAGLPE
jgi:serine/threonine protein kinase/tetratricopeptide (TPR) repeat protein